MRKDVLLEFKRILDQKPSIVETAVPRRMEKNLRNERRLRILEYLCAHPGSNFCRLAAALRWNTRTLHWNLQVLVKENIIVKEAIGNRTIYAPMDMVLPQHLPLCAAFGRQNTRNIVRLLGSKPGLTVGEISSCLKLSCATVKRNIEILKEFSVVQSVRDGRFRRFFLTRLIDDLGKTYSKREKLFREQLIKLFNLNEASAKLLRVSDGVLHLAISEGSRTQYLKLVTDPFSGFFRK